MAKKKAKFLLVLIVVFIGLELFSSCRVSKGRQQPKKGPMPCPVYDC